MEAENRMEEELKEKYFKEVSMMGLAGAVVGAGTCTTAFLDLWANVYERPELFTPEVLLIGAAIGGCTGAFGRAIYKGCEGLGIGEYGR